jgi:hypothetical protein
MTKGSFEAIKYAYRQTKDGFVLSFVVHPSDMTDDMATAPIGQRFMIAYGAITDSGAGASTAARERVGDGGEAHKATSSPTRTNSQRAAFLLKNPDFRRFLSALAGDTPPTVTTEEQANQNLKAHFGIPSKADLDHMDAGWGALLGMFKAFQQAQGHGVI